jgi:hypothetical protein
MTKLPLRTAAVFAAAAALLSPRPAAAAPIAGPHSVSAFYSDDDHYLHAIVAQTSGDVREVFYVPGSFHSSGGVIAHFDSPIAAVASYYTSGDRLRHVIVALQNWQVWEVYFNPQVGISQAYIATMHGAPITVSAWADTPTSGYFGATYQPSIAIPPGDVFDETDVYRLSNHVASFTFGQGVTATTTAPHATPDVAGTFLSSIPSQDALVYAALSSGGPDWTAQVESWLPSTPANPHYAVSVYPDSILPISMGVIASNTGTWPSWKPFYDVVALDDANHLLEVVAGAASTPSIGWTFSYGPKAISLGVTYDPTHGAKHAPVMMANGDLWDMYAPRAFGSAWSYDYLGSY